MGSAPLPPPPPMAPEPTWAPVVEPSSAQLLPRLGESMMCNSPAASGSGLHATLSNLQEHGAPEFPYGINAADSNIDDAAYPESPGEDKPWLRPPFAQPRPHTDLF